MLVGNPACSEVVPNGGIVKTVEETGLEISGSGVGNGGVDGLNGEGSSLEHYTILVGFNNLL